MPIPLSVGDLPVVETLDVLGEALARRNGAVLVAPPGAGKTTRVPLVLLDEPWAAGRKLILLEPRRLAARPVPMKRQIRGRGGRFNHWTRSANKPQNGESAPPRASTRSRG